MRSPTVRPPPRGPFSAPGSGRRPCPAAPPARRRPACARARRASRGVGADHGVLADAHAPHHRAVGRDPGAVADRDRRRATPGARRRGRAGPSRRSASPGPTQTRRPRTSERFAESWQPFSRHSGPIARRAAVVGGEVDRAELGAEPVACAHLERAALGDEEGERAGPVARSRRPGPIRSRPPGATLKRARPKLGSRSGRSRCPGSATRRSAGAPGCAAVARAAARAARARAARRPTCPSAARLRAGGR